jgi:hypothetical protein
LRAARFSTRRRSVGYVLRRLPAWAPLRGRGTSDYQDMPAWRTWTLAGIRATRLVRRTVIVPMAFTNQAYLAEIRAGIQRFDPHVRHFCLIAPLEIVQERLSRRGTDASTADGAWAFRRASDCCAVHTQPEFGEHVPAAGPSAETIAAEIISRLALS